MTTSLYCHYCGNDSTGGACDLQSNPICLDCWHGLSSEERKKIKKRLEAEVDAQIPAIVPAMASTFAASTIGGNFGAGAECSSSSGGGTC